MTFKLLKKINNSAIKKDYKKIKEYTFYLENNKLLKGKVSDLTNLIDINIIYQGMMNKQIIEDTYARFKIELEEELKHLTYEEKSHLFNKYLEPIIENLIYFENENQKIYIPFFNIETNKIYTDNMLLTDLKQYSEHIKSYKTDNLDFKKLYGLKVYESEFTNLILMYSNDRVNVFYHEEMKCLYRFDKEVKLIDYLRLIDKKNKNVQAINLDELKKISVFYGEENEAEMIGHLYEYGYIQEKRYLKYLKKLGR